MAAAAELPRVGLQDAIEVCLLRRDEAGDRFERAAVRAGCGSSELRVERAAVRWLGRFALEARGVTIEAIHTAAAALGAMPDQTERAMTELANLCVEP